MQESLGLRCEINRIGNVETASCCLNVANMNNTQKHAKHKEQLGSIESCVRKSTKVTKRRRQIPPDRRWGRDRRRRPPRGPQPEEAAAGPTATRAGAPAGCTPAP